MLECVMNVSEGRRLDVVDLIARNAGQELLDVHTDADHNRSVITLVGEGSAESVAAAAVGALDLRRHVGVHPRLGVVDVVPFVPLGPVTLEEARASRDRFARWLAAELGVPSFLYGRERSLPELRRRAFRDLPPDFGPTEPHPTAGATAVGARPVLVAYNLWLADTDVTTAKRLAADVRGPHVRALGLPVEGGAQVSMNLLSPDVVGPSEVYDAVAARARIERAELVGLVPRSVLERVAEERWNELDLSRERTIESRLDAAGLPPS
jgi:glutamate formiminotransferase